MSSAAEKIAMLLALSNSSYEAEARSALLMARKLMAKHKLRLEDIEPQKEKRLVRNLVGIRSTKQSTPWASALAGNMAPQYCCRHFIAPIKNSRTVEIGFIGFEEDFDACRLAYCYAHNCVMSYCKVIKKNMRGRNTAAEIRQMCSDYGWGFCAGLKAAYDAQTAQHQEWGLVMVVPQEVEDEIAAMKKTTYAKPSAGTWGSQFATKGYQDGKAFDPAHRLNAPAKKGA